MKRLIILALTLLIAVWIGIKIKTDPGYVLIAYRHWTLEMPLWLAALLSAVLFFILYFLIRLVYNLFNLSGRFSVWHKHRLQNKSHSQTSKGLIELSEGHWAKAEKLLVTAAKKSETPLINYLSAARAAQQQAAYDRRDNYLRLGHQSTAGTEVAVGLTQAELQLKHGQLEQALATLRHLQTLVPHHKHVLLMLKNLYVQLADWQSLLELLPQFRKNKVLNITELADLEKQAYLQQLINAQNQKESSILKKIWLTVPPKLTKDPDLVAIYSTILLDNQEHDKAETLLRTTLKKHFKNSLVALYGTTQSSDLSKQLKNAETWLKPHKDNPTLLLCLGRLCIAAKLWGKARLYLESSIEHGRLPESYSELGYVLEHLGEKEQALRCYQKGLSIH